MFKTQKISRTILTILGNSQRSFSSSPSYKTMSTSISNRKIAYTSFTKTSPVSQPRRNLNYIIPGTRPDQYLEFECSQTTKTRNITEPSHDMILLEFPSNPSRSQMVRLRQRQMLSFSSMLSFTVALIPCLLMIPTPYNFAATIGCAIVGAANMAYFTMSINEPARRLFVFQPSTNVEKEFLRRTLPKLMVPKTEWSESQYDERAISQTFNAFQPKIIGRMDTSLLCENLKSDLNVKPTAIIMEKMLPTGSKRYLIAHVDSYIADNIRNTYNTKTNTRTQ